MNPGLVPLDAPPGGPAPASLRTPVSPRSRLERRIVWVLVGTLGAISVARAVLALHLPVPPCGLRTLTGIPCPFCGSTHALAAWSRGDLQAAFQWNPLVSAGLVALALWLILAGRDWWQDGNLAERIAARLKQKPWPAVLLGLVLTNWVYLIMRLPK